MSIDKKKEQQDPEVLEVINLTDLEQTIQKELSEQEAEALRGGLRPVTACETSSFRLPHGPGNPYW